MIALILGAFFSSNWSIHTKISILLVGSYILMVSLSIITSITHGNKLVLINPGFSSRYFYVPSVILLLLILSLTHSNGKGWLLKAKMLICCILLIASIGVGIKSYRSDLSWNVQWPNWAQEVGKYRADNSYNQLRIWPPNWYLTLEKP